MIDETTALLIRARGFIERGWCRYTQAVDKEGISIWPESEHAVAWCAYGALRAAGMPFDAWTPGQMGAHPAIERFHAATGGIRIDDFNNRQETVGAVLAAFDRAIAAGWTRRRASIPVDVAR